MNDIGMSPDYRSGYGEERCPICNRRITDSRDAETCVLCGREICTDCIATSEIDWRSACRECLGS